MFRTIFVAVDLLTQFAMATAGFFAPPSRHLIISSFCPRVKSLRMLLKCVSVTLTGFAKLHKRFKGGVLSTVKTYYIDLSVG